MKTRFISRGITIFLALAGFCKVNADIITYSDLASFTAQLGPNYYLNTFSDITSEGSLGTVRNYTGGSLNGFNHKIRTTPSHNLYGFPGSISTAQAIDPLIITFSGTKPTAVGGDFLLTEDSGGTISGDLIITLDDGSISLINILPTPSFYGFMSDGPTIQSIEIRSQAEGGFPTLDNLYIGTTSVPDGGMTVLLLGISLIGLGWFRGSRK